ncbi:hypothetical protein [Edaphobacter albus]|uniref:hypothetical protein n=1 Tax=Edaphobacter sp. 4G125 TaxID=2763071 RepID=UPI0016481C49|nr:hypothetical protein [Edaphobacter sp. 4G125]QNI37529.1 hypothetical protein H7846_04290 [Edaphobacter sp. 4G125]
MPVFPQLSRAPKMAVEEKFEDSTIRDEVEGGFVFTRPRYVRLRETRKIPYEHCTAIDRAVVKDFYRQVGGWASFTYTDRRVPNMAPEVMTVRFKSPPEIKDGGWARGEKRFIITIEIEQV